MLTKGLSSDTFRKCASKLNADIQTMTYVNFFSIHIAFFDLIIYLTLRFFGVSRIK